MSDTPTPIQKIEELIFQRNAYGHPFDTVPADTARNLANELTAANARIAELEKAKSVHDDETLERGAELGALARRLSEAQAQLAKKQDDLDVQFGQLQESRRQLASAREQLDWQNIPNRREPIRGGYEFYVNEEWTGIRDAAMGEDPGFSATLMKVRYDPDDERVRVRRVLDDDAILADLASARAAIKSVIDSAVEPDKAKFASMVPLEPLRAVLSGHLAGRTSPPASAEPGPASTWQAIETAPKSRTSILVHCAERRNNYVVYWKTSDNPRDMQGWMIFGAFETPLTEEPTHWDQLPPPPTQDGKEQGK